MARPNPDAIRDLVEGLDPGFAETVARWEIDIGEDWLGEPAVHVTIVFKDARIRDVWKSKDDYRKRLERALRNYLPEHYPFIVFSAESVALNPEEPARA